jgi:beta-phosphoglucomutase-like phosphatase (HAD superfamily)
MPLREMGWVKAVIFDMDGVLLDSPMYVRKSYDLVLREYGITPDPRDGERNHGRSIHDRLKDWETRYGFHCTVEEFSQKADALQFEMMKEIKPDLELLEFARFAKKACLKFALATASTRKRTDGILALLGLVGMFDVIISAEDVSRHKPEPDVYLEAAKKLGVDPADCIVIEDSRIGVKAAKRAGMFAVGLVTPYEDPATLGADRIINSFSELDVGTLCSLRRKGG